MKNRIIIFHPFFFATYAILGVYARNAAEIPAMWVFRPWGIAVALVALLYFLAWRWSGDPHRAGAIASLSLFWMFFGHITRVIEENTQLQKNLEEYITVAFVVWTIILFGFCTSWVWRHISHPQFITTFLNVTAVTVVVLPVFTLGSTLFQNIKFSQEWEATDSFSQVGKLTTGQSSPDIYLIIVDAYGRADFLQEVYGYDNNSFINALTEKGFYVAARSSANYPQTELSLASMLNMGYLNDLSEYMGASANREPLIGLLQHSEVRRALEEAGYQFVALSGPALFSQMRDADIYYSMTQGDINEFEGLILYTTTANFFIRTFDLDIPVPSHELHRRYILFALETLETVPNIPGPKFVFTHIMAPHPPFVFDSNGNPTRLIGPYNMGDASGFPGTTEEYISGYTAEMIFLNDRLLQTITAILNSSATPPIIIVLGDHGPGAYYNSIELVDGCLWERYSTLNAYYFPEGSYESLYPDITPVNLFRIVFNTYFGTDLNMLADRNYYAGWKTPYQFMDVTNKIGRRCIAP